MTHTHEGQARHVRRHWPRKARRRYERGIATIALASVRGPRGVYTGVMRMTPNAGRLIVAALLAGLLGGGAT